MSERLIWEIPEEEWGDLADLWREQLQEQDDFVHQVELGKQGHSAGMENGLGHINTYLHGTHKGRYILIGADSGVGKSMLSDFMYIYSLWRYCKRVGIRIYIKYFSFELSLSEKKAKWVCQWIKALYSLDLDTDYIMGRIPGMKVSEEHSRMVMRAYQVIREMMKDMEMFDGLLNPTGMLQRVLAHYEKIGTIHRDSPKAGAKTGFIRSYTPGNPEDVTLVLVDHLALLTQERGVEGTKQSMDRWSIYSVMLRNLFRTTIINIQQFSTSMMDAYRKQKSSEAAIAPQRLDFGDSTYTYRDADLVLGLVKPVQFDLKSYYGFDLRELGQSFLVVHIMKNRHGRDCVAVPLFMNPVSGMFYDMPLDTSSPSMTYYINEAKRIEELCRQYNSPQGINQ